MKCKIFRVLILTLFLAIPLWGNGLSSAASSAGLTDTEKTNILFLFELEKVAHDVYVEMYNQYGAYIFNNISESEQRHMNAVANLITKRGLDDSVLNNDPGVFSDSELQAEYNRLISEGEDGLMSALDVGIQIEELDIAVIEKMLGETSKADIERVMNNLLDGSFSHLAAFKTAIGAI